MYKHEYLVLINPETLESLTIEDILNLLKLGEVIASTDGPQHLQVLLT